MGTISITLPTIGQPNSTEDADIVSALTTLQNVINGNIDAANVTDGSITAAELAAAVLDAVGVTSGATIRRGKSIIATEESRTNTTHGTLATPDQVSNVVLPTDGLLAVLYQATWKESANGAARAGLYIGSNLLKTAPTDGANAFEVEADLNAGSADVYKPLMSSSAGLVSVPANATSYTGGDATTGQIVGALSSSSFEVNTSGPCYIFAAAGTYTISVRFRATSGSVTVKSRKLWVWSMGF